MSLVFTIASDFSTKSHSLHCLKYSYIFQFSPYRLQRSLRPIYLKYVSSFIHFRPHYPSRLFIMVLCTIPCKKPPSLWGLLYVKENALVTTVLLLEALATLSNCKAGHLATTSSKAALLTVLQAKIPFYMYPNVIWALVWMILVFKWIWDSSGYQRLKILVLIFHVWMEGFAEIIGSMTPTSVIVLLLMRDNIAKSPNLDLCIEESLAFPHLVVCWYARLEREVSLE